MRRHFLCAASVIGLAQATAYAQEVAVLEDPVDINEDTEGQVSTGTVNGGTASDISISTNGRVFLSVDNYDASPAFVMNSSNSVFIDAGGIVELESLDANDEDVTTDGGVAVQIAPGVTGDFEHQGSILAYDGYTPEDSETDLVDLDEDGTFEVDGEADGAFALDTNKIGLLVGELDANSDAVAGQAAVDGNIVIDNGSVIVEGQDSYGVRVVTDVTGDLLLAGNVTMIGERSTGVSIEADVGGDLEVGTVNTDSPEGQAVDVQGDVDGGIRIVGNISSSGYRITTRLSETNQTVIDAGDDDINATGGMVLAGSAEGGLFIDDFGSVVLTSGDASALNIGASGETLLFGEIVLPDDWGITDEEEYDEDTDGDALGYSFVVRGSISAAGVYDGRDSSALMVGGLDENGDPRAVVFESGGILVEGAITASAYDATSTAATFGAGTVAEQLHNQGSVTSTAFLGYESDGYSDEGFQSAQAYALVIDDGADIQSLFNDQGTIFALLSTGGQGATAILLNSDSMQLIENTGTISAVLGSLNEDYYPDSADSYDFDLVAIDARNTTTGVTVRQTLGEARDLNNDDEIDDPNDPAIIGDVLFGSGDDVLDLQAGTLVGDVAFGDGADTLMISGGVELTSAITDSDGQLDITIDNGQLALESTDTLNVTNITVMNNGVLDIIIDDADRTSSYINASGTVSFDGSTTLSVALSELVGAEYALELINATQLEIADDQTIAAGDAPYMYNTAITRSETDENALILTLERKTAAELGLQGTRAGVYEPILALFDDATNLGNTFAGLRTEADFMLAYDQLLPEYATSAIQFALASNDAAAGALATRLTNARMAPDDYAGMWVQEFGYYADRAGSPLNPGYRGEGIGLAVGIDRPLGPFYAVGLNLVGAASEMEEISGFDDPMVSISGQLGAYAALVMGGMDVSFSGAVGIDSFETERNVLIDDFSAVYYADWSGWHTTASFRAGRDINMGRWTMRPEANLTYLGLWESGFSETADADTIDNGDAGLALTVEDRESSALIGSATVSFGRQFGNETSWWAPSLRVGYRGEFIDDINNTSAYFGTAGDSFTLQSTSLPGSGALVGLGLSAGSNYSTFTFSYDADIRDDFVRHVARLMIRLTF